MRAHPGQRDALLDYLLSGVAALEELDGCYLYVVSRAPDDPDAIWVYEAWRSAADHRASLEHPAIQAAIAAARPLIAEMPVRIEVTPVGGKGLPDDAG
jgi:quinol monooxygenase YgiN